MWNPIHLFFDYFSGCEIITDPNLIRQIETESAFKSKFRSIKSVPFSEPWFTKKSKLQVEQLLHNSFHVDGYFLVNPDYSKENNSVVALYLSVMCSDVLHQFKIVQVCYDFWSQDPYNWYVVVVLGTHSKILLENCQNWKL